MCAEGQRRNYRDDRRGPRRDGRPDAKKRRKKVCYFCANKNLPDYRNIDMMKKFITERGKIMTERSSGCCAKHQRALAKQIKRARQIGFVPYTAE